METYKDAQELKEQKHQKALGIVNNAMPVLEKVRKDPSMKHFHDERAGSQWMGEWLKDQKKAILEIYNSSSLDNSFVKEKGIPQEVANFVRDVYQVVEM